MAVASNGKAQDPRLEKCGFAKLLGEGIEYYIRKYEIVLGRSSKSSSLDVSLGENMNISRQHAKIVYNFQTKCFELSVMGKNGVSVEGTLYTPASPPQPLVSQDLLTIGDQSFRFLLPKANATLPGTATGSAEKKSPPGASQPPSAPGSGPTPAAKKRKAEGAPEVARHAPKPLQPNAPAAMPASAPRPPGVLDLRPSYPVTSDMLDDQPVPDLQGVGAYDDDDEIDYGNGFMQEQDYGDGAAY